MHHFVALMLGASLGERLRAALLPELAPLRRRHPRALRLYAAEDLHVTLCFVGTLDETWRAPLVADLAQVVAAHPAPELRLVAPGAFPRRGRETVLWAGVEDLGGGGLAALGEAVRETCAAHGVAVDERPLLPHVTLARVRAEGRGRVPDAFFERNPELEWKPSEVRWVRSPRDGGSPAYRPAEVLPLGPRGGPRRG